MKDRILCPDCPQREKIDGRGNRFIVGSQLTLSELNYSGCGVDHFYCERCNAMFEVSYKVDQITKIEEID